jgi:hypothetical protein
MLLYHKKAQFEDFKKKKSAGRKTALEAMYLPKGTLFLTKGDKWLVAGTSPVSAVKDVPIHERKRWLAQWKETKIISYYGNRRPSDPLFPLGREEGEYRTVRHGTMTHYRQPTIGVGETFTHNGLEWLVISKTGYRGDAEYASSTTLLAIKVSY